MAKTGKVGPHSRPGKLALVDGRTAEGKLMRQVAAELTQHLGGAPSVVQCMMIDQAARLALRVHLMDMQALKNPEVSERNGRQRLAWSNALGRLLQELGVQPAKANAATLREHLATRAQTPP